MQARVKFFRPQPKQEWSEEDVKRLYSIGTQIGFLKGKYSECQKDIDWLHALAEKMGFHKCKTGEVITEWKKEDIDDKMLSKPKPEWSEEDEKMLDAYADEITDWCGKFNPELRDVIRATAYHFYTFRPHWLLDTMVEQGIFNKEDKK